MQGCKQQISAVYIRFRAGTSGVEVPVLKLQTDMFFFKSLYLVCLPWCYGCAGTNKYTVSEANK